MPVDVREITCPHCQGKSVMGCVCYPHGKKGPKD